MDIATALGLVLGIGAIVVSFIGEGGSILAVLKWPAMLIVIGGTIGASTITTSLKTLLTVPTYLKIAFLGKQPDPRELVQKIVKMAEKARRDGILALEDELNSVSNPFFKKAFHLAIDGTVVIGTRLWDPPDAPWADAQSATVFARELERLKLSIQFGRKLGGCVVGGARTIALVHYPPRYSDGRETAAVPLLQQAAVEVCVYGHLHGPGINAGFVGEHGNVRYVLASCDAVGFSPVLLHSP